MKAAILGADGITLSQVPVPEPKGHELLVKVRASSLNRADLFLVEGRVHGAHGGVGTPLGLEWAGDVTAVGPEVRNFKVGDRVMCSGIGGFAEYAVADSRRTFPFPDRNVGYDGGACLPVSLRTTYTSIALLGKLQPGETVAVVGASSGVGLMSLQVARELGASLIFGTSTKADRRERLAEFGAHVALDSNDPTWVDSILERTNGKGVDLLIDFLAGPLINPSMKATSLGGRIVNVGRMAGESGHFDFDLHSLRRIQYIGQTFRTRTPQEIGEIDVKVQAALWAGLEAGRIGVPIDVKLPLEKVTEAFDLMRANAHFGKIVLTQSNA